MQKIPIIVLSMLLATTAQAQKHQTNRLGGSTLRTTPEAEYRIGPSFGVRGITGYGLTIVNTSFNWRLTGVRFSIINEGPQAVTNAKRGQFGFLPLVRLSVSSAF